MSKRMFDFHINRLKIRVPLFLEVEGEGIVPVVGALLLCLIVIACVVWR
jgi:hypothetical protein